MAWVQRVNGVVTGCYAKRQEGVAEEELADNHAEVIAYLAPPAPSATDLEAACIAGTTEPPPPHRGFDLHRAFIAHVISTEAYRLGVNPGALTGAQLSAIRQRVANIYKALN